MRAAVAIVIVCAAVLASDARKPRHACRPDGNDCPSGERCASPEEARYNFCGKPMPGAICPEGQIVDACGHCFKSCGAGHDECPRGTSCNGSYCISPRRCVPVLPPPP
jgi:hypothetical protein